MRASPTLMSGLDGGFIHGQNLAAQHALSLSVHDGSEQINGPLDEVGQGASTDGNAGLLEALMLAIQRQVELELVYQ